MNKKCMGLLLALSLFLITGLETKADQLYGQSGWEVNFTADSRMDSNFGQQSIDEAISGMQPGDTITFTLKLGNQNAKATDWYMTNEVVRSLEDTSKNAATGGGAYAYYLAYEGANRSVVLFDSDTVGGDDSEGLKDATEALREDYIYLDTLNPGQGGTITLRVALDGETQDNAYQDTLADLRMRFAVEVRPEASTVVQEGPPGTPTPSNPIRTSLVRTGDETELLPFLIAMAVSGVLFLLLAFYGKRQNKKAKGKTLLAVLLLAFLFRDATLTAEAAGDSGADTYTVRIYTGQQGFMTECSGGSGSIAEDGKYFVLSGLRYRERITLSYALAKDETADEDGYHYFVLTVRQGETDDSNQISTIRFRTAEKYNIIGFRESGKDNSERVGSEAIERDQDFVVAYGLMKDAVEYTIAYVDTAGNTLRESESYYGTIGDKPVITYRYFDGYQPQAYNLTKTLSANAAENVFTFIYSRVTPPADIVITIPGPAAPSGGEESPAEGPVTVVPPGEETGGEPAAPEGGGEGGGELNIEDELTPQAPQEIVDLDDTQTPLANLDGDQDGAIGIFNGNAFLVNLPLPWKIAVISVCVLLLVGGFWLLLFRRKKEDDEEERSRRESGESL
ncbi:MAG: hypothetical protein NC432_02300 [Roseburia sp.]|nr:hypothetical protein [Roseburia sp.]MCM1097477.1 hypothetical protein [Ruminococcus flavefaciens]